MLLLIKYGEIGLKSSQVQPKFEQQLEDNLSRALDAHDITHDIVEHDDRIFADVDEDAAADTALILSRVPGVVAVLPVEQCDPTHSDIVETTISILDGMDLPDTFAVRARRAGEQHDFTSSDLEEAVGQAIVDAYDLDVDLDDPDLTVTIEARYTSAYIATDSVVGVGGLPIADDQHVVVIMEDRASTVAAYRLMKRGCTVHLLYTGQEAEKLEDDIETLRQYDPRVKLTVMKDASLPDALDTFTGIVDCAVVAFGDTVDDLPDVDRSDLPYTVLQPNSGDTTEEVLDVYGDIMHFHI